MKQEFLSYYPEKIRKVGFLYKFSKRAFDILLSFFAIVLLSPLFVIFCIIVAICSKGSPIFCDHRIGKNGKAFSTLKFRTMYKDAEEHIHDYLTDEEYEEWLRERKVKGDKRIFKFGNFLRVTSLDELPQLFNILFGTMSFVGPRPITQREYDLNYSEKQAKLIQSATPGLTGNWQVYGRSDSSYISGKRSKLELDYFSKRSVGYDLKLLFLTFVVVFKREGAY